jgi:hypothetical protein
MDDKDEDPTVPPGTNPCSIHYYLAFCDCPPGT